MNSSPHVHADALRALIAKSPLTKSEIAMVGRMSPSQLSDLLSGRKPGRDDDLRLRLARALDVSVAAITCPCENAAIHGRPEVVPA